mmetsp:Transcript_27619/g.34284  ORF Transcript_27619/g.34284 Transcript_27619/m.34284 type:complete len:165 (-) Transcript_27619:511-1005(-)
MKKATLFCYYDYEFNKLKIDGRMSIPGKYMLEFLFGEIIDGVKTPPTIVNINLTVTTEPIPPPPLEAIRVGSPVSRIKEILMDGSVKITFDEDLVFPEGMGETLMAFKRRSVPQRHKLEYMIAYIEVSVLPGVESEPELVQLEYQVTGISSSGIDLYIKFDNPF